MAAMWTPKFEYPVAGTVLTLTRPMRHWSRRKITVGGMREAASGARAARTIRRDFLLDIVLRIDESELTAVETLHSWMEDNIGTAFRFWPDVGVAGTSFDCVLVKPVHGEDLTPVRSSEFASDLEVSLTLRRSNGAAWTLAWYPD